MNETFLGHWTGTNLLHLSWLPRPEHHSPATLTVATLGSGHFWELTYTWSHEDTPHEGALLLRVDPKSNKASAAWGDTWHQSESLMALQGEMTVVGKLVVQGSYPAPPGPDWGWRITLEQTDENALELVMTNILPDGTEDLAVRACFTRA